MDARAYWIGFNKVSGIGPVRLAALLQHFGSVEEAWRAPIQELRLAGLDRRSTERLLEERRRLELESELERVRQSGVRLITWDDADYPANLRTIEAPPPVLYVRGEILETDIWAVAVVGTRRASVYGREVAHTLSAELGATGVTVVSGLALGIDSIAHKSTLDAGGRTLAVLGSGIDHIYPPENRGLAQRIESSGALVSEYALGTGPTAANFPARNRIISGLSKGVVIVEAGERSGALITANFAVEQGREVFAVPGSILHPGSAGCNELIRQGAIPLLSVEDVLNELNLTNLSAQRSARAAVPPDPQEAKLLTYLSKEPCHLDDLVRASGMAPSHVASLLAVMELKGLVHHVGTMRYVSG